jgi:hypothetical protein
MLQMKQKLLLSSSRASSSSFSSEKESIMMPPTMFWNMISMNTRYTMSNPNLHGANYSMSSPIAPLVYSYSTQPMMSSHASFGSSSSYITSV